MRRAWLLLLLAGCDGASPGEIRVRVREDGGWSPAGPFPKDARLVIDAPLDAPFQCVKPLLVQAIENDGITDLAFRLDGRVLDFPVEASSHEVLVLERGTKTVLWSTLSDPEAGRQINVRAGREGALLVETVRRAGVEVVEDPLELPRPPPPPPPLPREWSADRLGALLRERPASYAALKISGKERVADVLLCLEALKGVAGRRILPLVRR